MQFPPGIVDRTNILQLIQHVRGLGFASTIDPRRSHAEDRHRLHQSRCALVESRDVQPHHGSNQQVDACLDEQERVYQ